MSPPFRPRRASPSGADDPQVSSGPRRLRDASLRDGHVSESPRTPSRSSCVVPDDPSVASLVLGSRTKPAPGQAAGREPIEGAPRPESRPDLRDLKVRYKRTWPIALYLRGSVSLCAPLFSVDPPGSGGLCTQRSSTDCEELSLASHVGPGPRALSDACRATCCVPLQRESWAMPRDGSGLPSSQSGAQRYSTESTPPRAAPLSLPAVRCERGPRLDRVSVFQSGIVRSPLTFGSAGAFRHDFRARSAGGRRSAT